MSVYQFNTADFKSIRVSAIMDEFTYLSYKEECTIQQLTPQDCISELNSFKPELLFIESAWRGKDDLWGAKVGHTSSELIKIVEWCKSRSIPTLFWNKEDPIHFHSFLKTAALFDFVFTTDIDCVPKYKKALGHNNVYFLPFGCQPTIHNPIEKFTRKDGINFAGAYYAKYPERAKNFDAFIDTLSQFKPIEIYDRNYYKNDDAYKFPEKYKPYIIGNLPASEIDKAYKGYEYSINMNSIKYSQGMMARRVFELLASNTIIISNYNVAIKRMFGDLIINTDNAQYLANRFEEISSNDDLRACIKLNSVRTALTQHSYEHRFAYILSKITHSKITVKFPEITVFALINKQEDLSFACDSFIRQNYPNKKFIIFNNSKEPLTNLDKVEAKILNISELSSERIGDILVHTDFIANFSVTDYYGENYLLDLSLASKYVPNVEVITKSGIFTKKDTALIFKQLSAHYSFTNHALKTTSIYALKTIAQNSVIDWLFSKEVVLANDCLIFAIDQFGFCYDMPRPSESELYRINGNCNVDMGMNFLETLESAESMLPSGDLVDEQDIPFLSGKLLSDEIKIPSGKLVSFNVTENSLQVSSDLADGKHEYFYSNKTHSLDELNVKDGKGSLFLEVGNGLNVQIVLQFNDTKNKKISAIVKSANTNHTYEVPSNTASIKLGLRIYASGTAEVKGLYLDCKQNYQMPLPSADYLVLTNHYPNYDDLYRNGFVHSRVREYKLQGLKLDVYKIRENTETAFYEFEGVNVISGTKRGLDDLLKANKHKAVLIHFLDPDMWDVLQHYIDSIKIIVWIHGAEVQPWYRRSYNYNNEIELNKAKKESDIRITFWQKVFKSINQNMKLIFVSKYFAQEVMEDVGVSLREKDYGVIHNFIDVNLFCYEEKPISQRKQILSIRPYASNKYANDLSVNAVLELSKDLIFNDLEFLFIGDGMLFKETLEPLNKFKNVKLEQRFLTQHEIAAMHKKFGLFLTPTRMDAQGVSRDEAMSSGLIPFTNGVTAIPEFVDDGCGILAAGESYQEFVDGIKELYHNPDLFLKMSKAASERVKNQSGYKQTIAKEVEMILNASVSLISESPLEQVHLNSLSNQFEFSITEFAPEWQVVGVGKKLELEKLKSGMEISSDLEAGQYVYCAATASLHDSCVINSGTIITFEASGALEVALLVEFLGNDLSREKIIVVNSNTEVIINIREDLTSVKFWLRVEGYGKSKVGNVLIKSLI